MSGKKSPVPGGLVTSDAVYHGHFVRRIMTAFAGVVLLAGAGAGTYFAAQKFSQVSNTPKQQTQISVTPAQAIKNAKDELQHAGTSQEKAAAYTHLGDAYFDNQQTKDAVDSYNSALSDAQSASDTPAQVLALGGLITTYTRAGDTANEIKALEQIIALLQKSTDPDDKRLAFRYQSLLDNLKGQ